MTLQKLWRAGAHAVIFAMGLRMLTDADPSQLDGALLALAAVVCVALLYWWHRAPDRFGHDPQLVAQLLMHGLAIIALALATRGLARFAPMWLALAGASVVAALAAIALASARSQRSGEALWQYGRMALVLISPMSLAAAVIVWFGQRAA